MKISICGSIAFSNKLIEIHKKLGEMGHETEIPFYTQKILDNKITENEIIESKKTGDDDLRKKANIDLIKRHYENIKNSDAILVCNFDKNGIKNYIGGNTFLEMGFAYVLNKKIFLLNDIPEMIYLDELKAVEPIIINKDLSKIN